MTAAPAGAGPVARLQALLRGPLQRAAHWRLSTRIVLLSLALLLLVQAAGFFALSDGIERNARRELKRELAFGEQVWRRLVRQRAQTLEQGAALLAADWGFRDAVKSQDGATIASALENSGARIGASFGALLGTDLRVIAHSEGADGAAVLPVLARLSSGLARQRETVAPVADQAWQFVMVPLKAPLVIGWVVMGFPVDRALLDDMKAVSGVDAALVVETHGRAPAVAAGTLALPGARLPDGRDELRLGGQPYLLQRVAMHDDTLGRVTAVLFGSVQRAVQPYRAIQLTLGIITVLGLLLFATGSVMTARRLAQPLRSLVHASDRLAAGRYDEPLAHTGRHDEIGDLAKAFDHMRTSIAAQQAEVRRLAYWDRLTGLPNRLQFREAVAAAIAAAAATREPLAVLMLDLDRFKHVNDVLGYAQGDRLLQAVAVRLREAAREGDMVARLGGDEFALLLPASDLGFAEGLARRVAAAFEAPLALDDQRVDLSAGIGIAAWPQHAEDADLLLSRAEVAMYAAKRQTAGATVYDPSKDSASAQTLSLLSELRRAVEEGELRLFLQPKIDLAGGTPVGAEALVRWQHPQRGLVPPMQFIPFAEQTGFIRRLTLWMFEECARLQPQFAALGLRRLSVNLSTRDLLDLELPEKLAALLARHGAQAPGFCLEITESAIMDDPQRAEVTLNRLSAMGFKLSIDDFGTGYSSLAYLKRLPVNELKIDKSFVMAMEREAGDAKIVRSTIDLAHNLGLTVVAEGVENAQIAQALAALRCDEAQGYHYSKPVPVDDFVAWARRARERAAAAEAAALA